MCETKSCNRRKKQILIALKEQPHCNADILVLLDTTLKKLAGQSREGRFSDDKSSSRRLYKKEKKKRRKRPLNHSV